MGAGIASLLWPATQFCIINRPISGEHLGESIKVIINPPLFSTETSSVALALLLDLILVSRIRRN